MLILGFLKELLPIHCDYFIKILNEKHFSISIYLRVLALTMAIIYVYNQDLRGKKCGKFIEADALWLFLSSVCFCFVFLN